jgi:hypothetical protein
MLRSQTIVDKTTKRARAKGRFLDGLSLLVAFCRAADDTVVGSNGLRASLMLCEVHGDMGQRNEVEGNGSKLALTIVASIPHNDVVLGSLGEILERNRDRRSALTSEVHGGLEHVTRSTTIIATSTSAVLSNGRVTVGREQANGASAVHRTLKLGQVVGSRKDLLGAGGSKLASDFRVHVGEEQTRTAEWSLLHDRGVAELLDECLTTLNGSVGDLSSLVGSVSRPAATLDVVDESNHTMNICEIDEGITDIATRLEIDAKVYEVVGTEALLIEDSFEGQLQRWSVKH